MCIIYIIYIAHARARPILPVTIITAYQMLNQMPRLSKMTSELAMITIPMTTKRETSGVRSGMQR